MISSFLVLKFKKWLVSWSEKVTLAINTKSVFQRKASCTKYTQYMNAFVFAGTKPSESQLFSDLFPIPAWTILPGFSKYTVNEPTWTLALLLLSHIHTLHSENKSDPINNDLIFKTLRSYACQIRKWKLSPDFDRISCSRPALSVSPTQYFLGRRGVSQKLTL